MKNAAVYGKTQRSLEKHSTFVSMTSTIDMVSDDRKMRGLGIIQRRGNVFRPSSAVKQAEALAMIVSPRHGRRGRGTVEVGSTMPVLVPVATRKLLLQRRRLPRKDVEDAERNGVVGAPHEASEHTTCRLSPAALIERWFHLLRSTRVGSNIGINQCCGEPRLDIYGDGQGSRRRGSCTGCYG